MPTARNTTMSRLRAAVLVSIVMLGPVYAVHTFWALHSADLMPSFEQTARPGTQCLKAMGNNTVEHLGDLVQRNQLAFYIANLYHAKMSFPSLTGPVKGVDKHFSNCLMPHPICILRHEEVGSLKCPRGDCGCIAFKLSTHLRPLSNCSVPGVENQSRAEYEYSVCMRAVLRRYFGQPSRWPRLYDAVHFVDGALEPNLREVADGESCFPDRFRDVMRALCVLSDRDIIVVTKGTPKIPLCKNRTVLANVSTIEAIKIMEHAHHISVGSISVGKLMVEMATPERVVLLSEVYNTFLWLRKPRLTIVRREGHMFHFAGGTALADVKGVLEQRRYKHGLADILTEARVRKRRWEREAKCV